MTEYEIKRLENRIRELWNEKEDLMKEKEELENQNRLLGERCNQLLKDKGELTDKIDDIKANCDLAIEGRDIKIKELEDHLAEEVELHLHAEEYIKSLEQQIEKMKCCGNCRFSESDTLNGTFCHREGCFVVASAKCKLWEM